MSVPKQKQTMLLSCRGKQSTSDHSHLLVYSHDPFNLLAFSCAWKLLTEQQSHGDKDRESTNKWGINRQEKAKSSSLQHYQSLKTTHRWSNSPETPEHCSLKIECVPTMHWDLFLGCTWAKSGLWIRRTLLFDDEAHSTRRRLWNSLQLFEALLSLSHRCDCLHSSLLVFFERLSITQSSARANGRAAVKAHMRRDHISLRQSLMISSYSAFGRLSSWYTSGKQHSSDENCCVIKKKRLMASEQLQRLKKLGRSKVCRHQTVTTDTSTTEMLIIRPSIRARVTFGGLTRKE